MTLVLTSKTHVVTNVLTIEAMLWHSDKSGPYCFYKSSDKWDLWYNKSSDKSGQWKLKIVVTKINLAEVTNCNICCHFHHSRLPARNTAVLFRVGKHKVHTSYDISGLGIKLFQYYKVSRFKGKLENLEMFWKTSKNLENPSLYIFLMHIITWLEINIATLFYQILQVTFHIMRPR